MKRITIQMSAVAIAAASLSGCAAIDTAQQVYGAAKTGYTVKSAVADVKDIKDAKPVFAGYSAVSVSSELHPRDANKAASIPGAFNDSIGYQVEQLASAAGARIYVCPSIQSCGGRVLSIQFREEAYDAGWAEKITMGSQLKGKLLFVDAGTGQVISERRVEGVNNYGELLGVIRGSLMNGMLKSFPNANANAEAFNSVVPVKPGYEKLLSAS